MIKLLMYILITPFVMWSVIALNIEKYFKKGKVNQIKIAVILLTISISYLVTSFFYDIINLELF